MRLDAAGSRSREGNVPLYPVEDNEEQKSLEFGV